MYVQILTIHPREGKLEEIHELYRDYLVPEIRQQEGYRGFYLIPRPAHGQLLAVTMWKDRAAAEGAEEQNLLLEQRAGYPLYASAPEKEGLDVLYFNTLA